MILAGGDGSRLSPLTRTFLDDGRPKQFCPLLGGKTLLAQTRLRAAKIVAPSRMLFALTKKHEPFYAVELAAVASSRMIVQPCNRGTLPAILWSLLQIIDLDPDASVALFPSDHYYANEDTFVEGTKTAMKRVESGFSPVVLLGALAARPETEYGWIEPGTPIDGSVRTIKRFWEKPSLEVAQGLLDRDCLWNTFVMAGTAASFLELIRKATPEIYRILSDVSQVNNPQTKAAALSAAYDSLPMTDFSRSVLSVSTEALTVASLGDIGWSDLGDPRRLVTTLFESGIENPWVEAGSCNYCGAALAAP